MNPMHQEDQKIKEQRLEAQKFTRELIPVLLPSITTEVLHSAFSMIEKRRNKIDERLEIELAGPEVTEDQKKEINEKSFGEFLTFQGQVMEVAYRNIRTVLWGTAVGTTGDYFPDLINEEKKRQEAQANQAQDEASIIPRISVLQGDPPVDSGQGMCEPQGSCTQ